MQPLLLMPEPQEGDAVVASDARAGWLGQLPKVSLILTYLFLFSAAVAQKCDGWISTLLLYFVPIAILT